jgi:hypothetical protein
MMKTLKDAENHVLEKYYNHHTIHAVGMSVNRVTIYSQYSLSKDLKKKIEAEIKPFHAEFHACDRPLLAGF